MHRYQATHAVTGVTAEVVELVGPSGGWPEIKYTGNPDLIAGICELIYPDEDVDPEPDGSLTVPFVYDEARMATPGWVLERVMDWLDDLSS